MHGFLKSLTRPLLNGLKRDSFRLRDAGKSLGLALIDRVVDSRKYPFLLLAYLFAESLHSSQSSFRGGFRPLLCLNGGILRPFRSIGRGKKTGLDRFGFLYRAPCFIGVMRCSIGIGGHFGSDDLPGSALLIRRQFHDVVQKTVGIRHYGIRTNAPSRDSPGTSARSRAVFRECYRHQILAAFRSQLIGPHGKNGLPAAVGNGAHLGRHNVALIPFRRRQPHGDDGSAQRSPFRIREFCRDFDGGYVAHDRHLMRS